MLQIKNIEVPSYDFIVAFDFDGTLFTEAWPSVGEPIDYMHEVVQYCFDQGYIIVLNTLREDNLLKEAISAIYHFDLPIYLYNCNLPHRIVKYGDQRKIGYDILIDDRNAGGLLPKDTLIKTIDYGFMKGVSRLLFPGEQEAIQEAFS